MLRDARTGLSREVVLSAFTIAAAPVTVGQFAETSEAVDGSIPVHGVTWFDAVAWCNEASRADGLPPAYTIDGRDVVWDLSSDGYRLPTEAEWEWAARGGSRAATYGPLEEVAWTAADGVHGPQPVGKKRANPYGLVDAIGNVWEWCWDYADPARYADYRSLRGGGWADEAWSCRASVRRGSAPDAVLEDVGFRVARGPAGSPGATEGQGWSAAADRERANVRGPLPIGWTPLRSIL